MSLRKTAIWAAIALACLSCERYVVAINNNEVYTPPPTFIQTEFVDSALKTCLNKAFTAGELRRAEQLTQLQCRDAGVKSLEGLSLLTQLTEADLAGNLLGDLQPLLTLANLQRVNLMENPLADCRDVRRLEAKDVAVAAPEHCED